MTGQHIHREIAAGLGRLAGVVDEIGFGLWRFPAVATAGGAAPFVTARFDQGWLHFDTPLAGADCVERAAAGSFAERLLAANAGLAGGAKYAFVPRDPAPHARAEVPLEPDADPVARMAEASAGIRLACERWQTAGGNGTESAIGRAPEERLPEVAEGLRAACRETGWTVHERADGRLAVELAVPGSYLQAAVAAGPGGGARLSVDLPGQSESPHPAGERAVALLLLRVSGLVRLARATPGRLEVVFPWRPSATDLVEALSALSVACRLCAREAEFLARDPGLAGAYLRAAGLPAPA